MAATPDSDKTPAPSMVAESCTIEEINDIQRASELETVWGQLLEATPRANFFQSWHWLNTYWKHFGDDQILRLLVVRREGQPIGILPLAVRDEKTRLGRLRVLGYPLDSWGTRFGPISASPFTTLTAGLQYLRESRSDWDYLDLCWIDRRDEEAAENAFCKAGMTVQLHAETVTSCIQMDGSWDDYWMSRTSKWRNNVRRNEKRLHAAGDVQFVHHRPAADSSEAECRWDLYDMCEHLAARSWQGASENGNTLSHERVRGFLRDLHRVATRVGAVSTHVLLLDEQAVAFAYNYVQHGNVFGLRMGFDPKLSKSGPGSVLLRHAIEFGYQMGDCHLDFGESPSAFKRHWRNETAEGCRLSHYPFNSIRAQALYWKRRWCEPATECSKSSSA